jgi:predicted acyltransferase
MSQETITPAPAKKRLLSLDVLRGITIAGMILVNNPGTWSHIYAPLRHAAWNGCTPTDLVFPFFVFCMGIAMYISHKKTSHALTWPVAQKVITRGLLIVIIGWALSWLGMFLGQITQEGTTLLHAVWTYPIENIRILGVFPRLGLVSIFGGLLMLAAKPKNCPWVAAVLMIIYCIMQSVTNSFELNAANMESIVDLKLLGDNHIYHMKNAAGERIAFDPEGVLSTIPCVAHVLIGAWMGHLIMNVKDIWGKVTRLLLAGAVMMILGFLLDYAYPINKSMWSASYILVTCGLASSLLAILTWILDIRLPERNMLEPTTKTGKAIKWFANSWYKFFECFGVNPLFIFCLSAIAVYVMRSIKFTYEVSLCSCGDLTIVGDYNVWSFWYKVCMQPLFGNEGGSLACALSLVCVLWGIAYLLYRKKIYIKL